MIDQDRLNEGLDIQFDDDTFDETFDDIEGVENKNDDGIDNIDVGDLINSEHEEDSDEEDEEDEENKDDIFGDFSLIEGDLVGEEDETEDSENTENSENDAFADFNFDDIGLQEHTEKINESDLEFTNADGVELKIDTSIPAHKKTLADYSDEELNKLSAAELEQLIEAENNNEYENNLDTRLNIEDSTGADHDGSILSDDSLLLDNLDTVNPDADFISDTGEIVVMDNNDNGDNFKFQYIDIENIAIVKRIRKNSTNVEDLVQSIKSTGLLEPLVVAPTATEGTYVLLAGFRRIMACAKAGKRKIPCIVNIKANVPEIPVLEALYNHSKSYTIKEIVDYIDYLEKQKGIMSASMIEYLLQLNSGDYTKLKDILNDNDDDIVSKLYDGIYNIETAFKKLEQRRKKESAEEKENKKAAKVYEDEEESGAANIAGSGDEAEDEGLTADEIQDLAFSADDFSESVEGEDFQELIDEGKNIEGFQPHKQDPKERERLDPTLRKAVLARDNNTCQICKMASGQEFTETLDVHHIVEVYLGGNDDISNLITACTVCHKLIHLYGRGELNIRPLDKFETDQDRERFKRVVKLGNVIRKGLAAKGMKREQLKKVDGAGTIGRTKPGTGQVAG